MSRDKLKTSIISEQSTINWVADQPHGSLHRLTNSALAMNLARVGGVMVLSRSIIVSSKSFDQQAVSLSACRCVWFGCCNKYGSLESQYLHRHLLALLTSSRFVAGTTYRSISQPTQAVSLSLALPQEQAIRIENRKH